MKSMINRILLLIFILLSSNMLLAQITFNVSDVKIATDTIKEVSYRDALEARIGAKIESYNYSKKDSTIIPTYAHSFVAALHHCYADHRPMVISPDMIWLMICQGLAQHIGVKSDSLREQLVRFSGKKKIIVKNNNLIKGKVDNNWAGDFPKFADSIKKYVDEHLYNFILQEYSTTTKTEKIAYQTTLMKSVESYFEYITETECGIPMITLEGTTKDWIKILRTSRKLDDFEMSFWTKELIPVLEEFVKASKGKIDQKFWQSIYKYNNNCGQEGITGWIQVFFPYLHASRSNFKNKGIAPILLPTGIAKIDLTWLYTQDVMERFKMEIYSGFLGIEQDKNTMALKPKVDWAIRDKESKKSPNKSSVFNLKHTDDGIAFMLVEKMPFFPGGDLGLKQYIAKNINYPIKAIKNKIEGKVFIRFVVTREGEVKNAIVVKGVNPILDNEAIRVISALPRWIPGSQRGRKVNVWYTVPVNFILNKN